MHTRPQFITDEQVQAVDDLTTSQLGQFFSWLMLTYAQRHGLNQEEIDLHKEAMRKAKPDTLIAEKMRLERLEGIKQVEINEIRESLAILNSATAQTTGKTEQKGE
jgi:hypothetical protein